ncbi:MAG: DEAD/DEAH box helicase [Sandaracinaceae bacterium]|nr:DEAD/DEAH box helicase [Sandaracinaceae bacterium]
MSGFDRLTGALQYQIVNTLRWTAGLRQVQEQTIDSVLDGDNCVVLAPTAGGKTEAAFFPLLSQMTDEDWRPVSVLYLSPIRALLNNQEGRVAYYAGLLGRRAFKWHGDVGESARVDFLRDPADILLITPESIEAMLMSQKIPTRELFVGLRAVVVDEIHAFADDDRGAHLASLLERISRYSGRDVQRIGLSATVGNPVEILRWVQGSSERASRVVDPGGERVTPEITIDYVASLDNAAKVIRALHPGKKRLVFTDSRRETEELGRRLDELGVLTYVIHGSLSVSARTDAERAFAEGQDCVIVSTSAMELGIDVGDLDHVLQIDAPSSVASFLQRMGRTGRRAGTVPNCTFLCTKQDRLIQAMALVALYRDGFVEPVSPSRRASHVLAHQILSLAIQHRGIAPKDWWPWLDGATSYDELTAEAREEIVEHMLHEDILTDQEGRLWLGLKGERLYGRANFRALYAVFESPRRITVQYANTEVGSVEATFLSVLEESDDLGTFTLGGRAWQVLDIDWRRGRCTVKPAEQGRAPRWSGGARHLGYDLCQAMRRFLCDDLDDASWSTRARAQLDHARAQHAFLEDTLDGLVDEGREKITWYNFAGGRANVLLARLLERDLGGRVISRNTSVTFTKEAGKSLVAVRDAIRRLRDEDRPGWPDALRFAPDTARSRVSKFQPCLPDHLARDLLVEKLVDLGSARVVLGLDPELPPPPTGVEFVKPSLPIVWVRTPEELADLCERLATEPFVALDVETTLTDQELCLVQLGTPEASYLVDPFTVGDLAPLEAVLESPAVEKVIHNAQFERSVLGKLGISIENVLDTLVVSRKRRGTLGAGHSLRAVVRRELDLVVDKGCQTSDWTRRPLSAEQEAYAALDVELLVRLRSEISGTPT